MQLQDSALSQPSLDPQFFSYLREPPRLSYTRSDDPWFTRNLVSSLEVLFGRRKVEAIYERLKARGFNVGTFFEDALREANISVDLDQDRLAAIPRQGPLLFVANHPFGVVDGVVLCDMALKVRGNLRIMLHSLLCQDRELAPWFLPIDFDGTREAKKTNLRSRQLAVEFLARDVPVLLFPAGMVSTAKHLGFGAVQDAPWTTFVAKITREARATVVPVYFHGRNTRKFHVASHIAEPLRMALLVHEALKKFGQSVRVEIGAPLPWEWLERQGGRQELTDYLYQQVQALGRGRSEAACEGQFNP